MSMKRVGRVLKLKPEHTEAYKAYHEAVWPEVLSLISECNIRNYSIFLRDNFLFAYFEYHGENMDADFANMAANPKMQEWWAIMDPMQEPLPTHKPGEWWAEMDEVFHVD